MAEPTMELDWYNPRSEKLWKHNDDGSFSARIYTTHGLVDFFAYKGGTHGKAFTKLEMYCAPHVYVTRLSRCYSSRWARRLAHEFAWMCSEASK